MDLTRNEHKSVRQALRLDEPISEALLQKAHQHFQHCQSCQQLIRESSQLRKLVSHHLQAAHPSADAILQYLAEMKQADYNGETFTPEGTAREVRLHLQECSLCRKRLSYYRQASDAAEQVAVDVLKQAQLEPQPARRAVSLRRLFPRWDGKSQPMIVSLLLAACLSVLYFGSIGMRQVWQSPFDRLGSLENEDFTAFAERSAPVSAQSEAAAWLKEIELDLMAQNFQQAQAAAQEFIKQLSASSASSAETKQAQAAAQEFIKQSDPAGYLLLRASLYDLFASLKLAHHSLWNPLAPRYDTATVAAALARSELVVAQAATHPALSRIQTFYLMHFYLAKGYLMLHEPARAQEHLSATATEQNYRREQAKQIQLELGQILNAQGQ